MDFCQWSRAGPSHCSCNSGSTVTVPSFVGDNYIIYRRALFFEGCIFREFRDFFLNREIYFIEILNHVP